jgi:hypothetical protein
MPTSLDDIPGRSRYPWEEWFNGEVHIIDPEGEWNVSKASLRAYLHSKAREMGGSVGTKTTPEDKLAFQFTPGDATN